MKRILSLLIGLMLTLSGVQSASAESTLTPVDLGTLGGNFSSAFDLNNSLQVVGFSQTVFGAFHSLYPFPGGKESFPRRRESSAQDLDSRLRGNDGFLAHDCKGTLD